MKLHLIDIFGRNINAASELDGLANQCFVLGYEYRLRQCGLLWEEKR
jgi:hypothetical protein